MVYFVVCKVKPFGNLAKLARRGNVHLRVAIIDSGMNEHRCAPLSHQVVPSPLISVKRRWSFRIIPFSGPGKQSLNFSADVRTDEMFAGEIQLFLQALPDEEVHPIRKKIVVLA